MLPIFDPPPDQIDKVIDCLLDPDHSFGTVARDYNTTVEALTLWMTRPDIDARISGVESAIARRTRLVSANYLGAAIHALHDIITFYLLETAKLPIRPGDTRALEYRRRAQETTRRAASLLARLARFTPGGAGFPARLPSLPSAHPPPNPFGGGGRVFEAGGGVDDAGCSALPVAKPAFSLDQLLSLLNSIQLPAPDLNGHSTDSPPHTNGAPPDAALVSHGCSAPDTIAPNGANGVHAEADVQPATSTTPEAHVPHTNGVIHEAASRGHTVRPAPFDEFEPHNRHPP